MPRHGRIDYPGALHHVIIRGINRSAIFKNDHDREEFILRLKTGLKKTGVICLAWALIPNHVHLLLRTGPHPLTELMRRFLTGYALYFNRSYDRVGYLFQNRYKSILCEEEKYLLQLVRYIHLNPLRARLVDNIQELNKFQWCGHSVILGNAHAEWQDTGEILPHFGSTVKRARRAYLEFVSKGISEGKRSDLTGGGLIRSVGGWQQLRELRKLGERWRGDERILGSSDFVMRALGEVEEHTTRKEKKRDVGWNLDSLMGYIKGFSGVKTNQIKGSKKDPVSSRLRSLFAWWATDELGFTLTEVARFLEVHHSTIIRAAERGCEICKKEDLQFPKGGPDEYRTI